METSASSTIATRTSSSTKAILITGLIAGTLDIAAATIVSGAPFTAVLKYVASGAFGREAVAAGGMEMAVAGLIFHFIIAYSWTILYFLIYPKIAFLGKHKIISGLLYGIFVWIIMNRVVVPLSQINPRPFDWVNALKNVVILMVMIGLPISLLAHRHYSKNKN